MSGTTTSYLPCVAAREEEDMKARFEEWIIHFDKTYEDEEDKAMRFQLFKGNVKWFESLPPSHRKELQIGYFSDFKDEECPSSRSCVHIDDTEDEVLCQNEKGLSSCRKIYPYIYT